MPDPTPAAPVPASLTFTPHEVLCGVDVDSVLFPVRDTYPNVARFVAQHWEPEQLTTWQGWSGVIDVLRDKGFALGASGLHDPAIPDTSARHLINAANLIRKQAAHESCDCQDQAFYTFCDQVDQAFDAAFGTEALYGLHRDEWLHPQYSSRGMNFFELFDALSPSEAASVSVTLPSTSEPGKVRFAVGDIYEMFVINDADQIALAETIHYYPTLDVQAPPAYPVRQVAAIPPHVCRLVMTLRETEVQVKDSLDGDKVACEVSWETVLNNVTAALKETTTEVDERTADIAGRLAARWEGSIRELLDVTGATLD